MTKLSAHFTLEDFTDSDTAIRNKIDNTVPESLSENLNDTVRMLEGIRTYLSKQAGKDIPVNITSGYRCLKLNRLLKSSDTSDHVQARAADIKIPAFGSPYNVCKALESKMEALGIHQLIHEYGAWVHVSTKKPSNPVNRVLTINSKYPKGTPGIVP